MPVPNGPIATGGRAVQTSKLFFSNEMYEAKAIWMLKPAVPSEDSFLLNMVISALFFIIRAFLLRPVLKKTLLGVSEPQKFG